MKYLALHAKVEGGRRILAVSGGYTYQQRRRRDGKLSPGWLELAVVAPATLRLAGSPKSGLECVDATTLVTISTSHLYWSLHFLKFARNDF